jgi:hypothetical protein
MRHRISHEATKDHAAHKDTSKDRQEVPYIHSHYRNHSAHMISIYTGLCTYPELTKDILRRQEQRPWKPALQLHRPSRGGERSISIPRRSAHYAYA